MTKKANLDICLNSELPRFAVWFALGIGYSFAISAVAARIHASGQAPAGLTSLGVGAVLGFLLTAFAPMVRFARMRWLMIGTLSLALLTVIAEHAWLYRDYCQQWRASRETNATVAMFRDESPPPPLAYFAREWNPGLWFTDAGLIVVTATYVVAVYLRNTKMRSSLSDNGKFDGISNLTPDT